LGTKLYRLCCSKIKPWFGDDTSNRIQNRMMFPLKPGNLGLSIRPEAQALWTKLAMMNADAAMTIAMRLPIFAHAAMGNAAAQQEAEKAVQEKISVIAETGAAATQAAVGFWWDVAMSPLTRKSPSESAARAARKTLGPASRRTRANRRRLTDAS
jgi:hypothetical protein